MLEKAYVRFRESLPDNQNTFAAADGFIIQGIEVVPFHGFGDINLQNMPDLGERAIVAGNICDIWEAMKVLGKPLPPSVDYPEHLKWMLKRNVRETTLEQVRGSTAVQF